jgi:aminoglycoside phosphotransferase (APT) family kinase protein
MIFWPEEGNLIAIAAPGSDGGMSADYCQTPQQLVQRYADATGRDMSHFQWYQAFAAWKLGIVLEASYSNYRKGVSKNPNHEFFGFVVDQLMLRAQRFAV